jgi:hypothetical protein
MFGTFRKHQTWLWAVIIGEDGLAAIAAVQDVTDGARIFQAHLASHADSVPGKEAIGQ